MLRLLMSSQAPIPIKRERRGETSRSDWLTLSERSFFSLNYHDSSPISACAQSAEVSCVSQAVGSLRCCCSVNNQGELSQLHVVSCRDPYDANLPLHASLFLRPSHLLLHAL